MLKELPMLVKLLLLVLLCSVCGLLAVSIFGHSRYAATLAGSDALFLAGVFYILARIMKGRQVDDA